jgi:hypothetical protein
MAAISRRYAKNILSASIDTSGSDAAALKRLTFAQRFRLKPDGIYAYAQVALSIAGTLFAMPNRPLPGLAERVRLVFHRVTSGRTEPQE